MVENGCSSHIAGEIYKLLCVLVSLLCVCDVIALGSKEIRWLILNDTVVLVELNSAALSTMCDLIPTLCEVNCQNITHPLK